MDSSPCVRTTRWGQKSAGVVSQSACCPWGQAASRHRVPPEPAGKAQPSHGDTLEASHVDVSVRMKWVGRFFLSSVPAPAFGQLLWGDAVGETDLGSKLTPCFLQPRRAGQKLCSGVPGRYV